MQARSITYITLLAVGLTLVGCATMNPTSTVSTTQVEQYCGSNGTLVNTMPMQSHRSYCIKTNTSEFELNTPSTYTFSIIDDQGNTLKQFASTHTKLMHVIIVRKDLAYFQHLHPEFNTETGEFTLSDVIFSDNGEYRVFADFMPETDSSMMMALPVTTFSDVVVGNLADYIPEPIGAMEMAKTVGDLSVELSHNPIQSGSETTLSFALTTQGEPVTDIQEYLGALGHVVILRESTLEFIHAHPVQSASDTQTGLIDFMVTFPDAGKYKVFAQVQRGGEVVTTDFVVSVAAGDTGTLGMDHSMMGH